MLMLFASPSTTRGTATCKSTVLGSLVRCCKTIRKRRTSQIPERGARASKPPGRPRETELRFRCGTGFTALPPPASGGGAGRRRSVGLGLGRGLLGRCRGLLPLREEGARLGRELRHHVDFVQARRGALLRHHASHRRTR